MKRLCSLLTLSIVIFSCRHQIANPYGDSIDICFEEQVLPIFQSSCAKSGCHNEESHAEGYVLDSYDNIIKQGIVAGDANKSEIVKSLTGFMAKKMPPSPHPALSALQIQFIATWINQGAKNNAGCDTLCNPEVYTYSGAVEPIVKNYCFGCHYTATSENKNVDLSSWEAIKVQVDKGSFWASVNHDSGYIPMPQNADKLNDCQLLQISNWIIVDSAENN